MRQKLYILIFCLFLVLPVGLSFIIKDNSNMENKQLAAFPKINVNTDSYLKGVNSFINDRIPFKSSVVKLVSKAEILVDNEYETEKGILGKNDWMFYKGDDGKSSVNDYLGINKPDEVKLNKMAVELSALNTSLKERGVNLIVMICPNKEDVFDQYLPNKYKKKEETKTYSQVVYSYLNKDFENILYPVDSLKKVDSFYKYDTHWNDLGAYMAVTEIEKKLNLKSVPFEEVSVDKTLKSDGDMISLLQLDSNKYNKDFLYKIDTKKQVTVKEIEKISTNQSVAFQRSVSNSNNKQQLFVIGDSFSNAMIPYLQEDFEKTTLLHRANSDMLNMNEMKKGDTVMIQVVARSVSSLDDIFKVINTKVEGVK